MNEVPSIHRSLHIMQVLVLWTIPNAPEEFADWWSISFETGAKKEEKRQFLHWLTLSIKTFENSKQSFEATTRKLN